MTVEQRTICKMLSKALFQKEPEFEKEICWDDVYAESIRQTVVAAVVPGIPSQVPFPVRMKWINAVGVLSKSNYHAAQWHLRLHRILSENGIPYTIIKGLASSRYYPDPQTRTLGDVDFIVENNYTKLCDRVLREQGFFPAEKLHPYEWEYRKDALVFEMHLRVNGIPEGREGKETERFLDDMVKTASVSDTFGEPLVLPDEFHHGLVILLHFAKHMVGEGTGIRQLCDWAVFVNHMGEAFPRKFELPLRKIGLWKFCLILSAVCAACLGMPSFSWIPQYDQAFLAKAADDMLQGGNFKRGNNTGARIILVEKTGKGGVAEGPVVKQLFKNLGQKVQYKWPVTQKNSILIPFGIVVMCTQYVFGVVTGKYEAPDSRELIREAKKRRELYKEYQLFKSDSVSNEND